MKKILSFLAAPYLMGALFVILATAMGIATFVENDFGTVAAKALYYNTWWFEGVFVLLGINMLLNLIKPKLWKWSKLPVLLFHLAFIVIVIGAALTRYIGYEGMMHIREGEATNRFLSSKTYISGFVEKGGEKIEFSKAVFMSSKSQDCFKQKLEIGGEKLKMESVSFVPNTRLVPVEDKNGTPMVSLFFSAGGERDNLSLFAGEDYRIGEYTVGFETGKECDFNIFIEDGRLCFSSKHTVSVTDMGKQEKSELDFSKTQPFNANVLYKAGALVMVQTNFLEGARLKAVPAGEGEPGIGLESVMVKVWAGDEVKEVVLTGRGDRIGDYEEVQLGDMRVRLSYGSIVLTTPFEIKLNDFQLDRYPGSESPSSFASEVTLKDTKNGVVRDFRIFMNNILNYRGYRFYQSSYDKDEKGTILSVNNDLWGTLVTYVGYFIMSISMLMSLFASKSRFRYLADQVAEIGKQKRILAVLGFFVLGSALNAQNIDAYINVSERQAKQFGELWVQDNGGRVKPLNTLNGEILRKLVKHNSFRGYSADRVVLSMLSHGEAWKKVPLITVKKDPLKSIVGNTGKKASFSDFFGPTGSYKLQKQVQEAYRTKPAHRNEFHKEVIKVDEQVNVFYLVHSGQLLRIFPVPGDSHAAWIAPGESAPFLTGSDSLFVRNIFSAYIESLKKGNAEEANTYVDAIANYQEKHGMEILPSESSKHLEITYNKLNVFLYLAMVLFAAGAILLVVQFVYVFLPKDTPKMIHVGGLVLMVVAMVVHTGGMTIRWLVAGYAPWTNGYESMLLIGWSFILVGLIFGKRIPIVLSAAGIFAGMVLMVSHLSWMNPEITPLVPVLKSYWLNIHVFVIVISYGFLGLGALLGFINLILIGLKRNNREKKIDLTVKELSNIVEMSLTVGLYLLTIGAFIGGVWANESWGRYWGWDPKETWSLVTVLFYAFVLHMRFIPGLKSRLAFNVASVVVFFSVIMTYLGVNYLLAGMHSYAKGDTVPIPVSIHYSVVTVVVVAVYAIYNSNRLKTLK